jgi:hypothetical protein
MENNREDNGSFIEVFLRRKPPISIGGEGAFGLDRLGLIPVLRSLGTPDKRCFGK